MEIKTLDDISLNSLMNTFNEAFSDYQIKLQFNEAQLLNKIKSENIQLSLSYGVFVNSDLVGFILTGIDSYYNKWQVYNAGTGVIPKYRGKKLVEVMYKHLLNDFQRKGICLHQLEVITTNLKAINVYKKVGFEIKRSLVCYKGKITKENKGEYEVCLASSVNFNTIKTLWSCEPTWQNSSPSLERILDRLGICVVYSKNEIIGYCIGHIESGRIYQIAVEKNHRRKGIGLSLLTYFLKKTPQNDLLITNVDESDLSANSFFNGIGLNPFLKQFEMKLEY